MGVNTYFVFTVLQNYLFFSSWNFFVLIFNSWNEVQAFSFQKHFNNRNFNIGFIYWQPQV
jgi:hypothetical protein